MVPRRRPVFREEVKKFQRIVTVNKEYTSSISIKSLATVVADLQYILKGIQGEDTDEAFCSVNKLVELTVIYFQQKIL